MTKSSAFAKGALAAAAGLVALGAAAAASAQPSGPGYSNYDPCRRDAGNRGIVGALIGGGIGATVGSQVAANHHRSDGSLLGGVVGAIAGASIGNSTAACKDLPPPPPPPMREGPPPPPPVAYDDAPPPPSFEHYAPPPARYAERETVWVYGRHGMRFRVMEDRFDRDGCTFAESPVYMPDGRMDHRYVRVCPDYRGRYHVVD
ncbi:MAG: glycine zipper 2TM domain-containing protein [Phenylobacterium sp.]